jgi:hypothetical protein
LEESETRDSGFRTGLPPAVGAQGRNGFDGEESPGKRCGISGGGAALGGTVGKASEWSRIRRRGRHTTAIHLAPIFTVDPHDPLTALPIVNGATRTRNDWTHAQKGVLAQDAYRLSVDSKSGGREIIIPIHGSVKSVPEFHPRLTKTEGVSCPPKKPPSLTG